MASRAGVNPQTLRYYERIGLLPDPPRTPAGYRDYQDDAVRVLRFVRRAKELGFQLDEISELLGLAQHPVGSCSPVQSLAKRRASDLDRRVSDLVRMRESLQTLAGACTPEHDEGEVCPLLDALDE